MSRRSSTISASLDRAQGGHTGPTPGAGDRAILAEIAELCSLLHQHELRVLLEPGAGEAHAAAEVMRLRLEDAAADALAAGHPLTSVSAAARPVRTERARFEVAGRLALLGARLAELEEVLIDEAQELGGEMPADRTAHAQALRAHSRHELQAAMRDAVLRGMSPGGILDIVGSVELDLDEGDLIVAFTERRVVG